MTTQLEKKSTCQAHLHRIVGQLNGIDRMLAQNKNNVLIVRQIMAAKASLEKLALRLLKEESLSCNRKKINEILDSLFRLN